MKNSDAVMTNLTGLIKATIFLTLVILLIPISLIYRQAFPDRPYSIPQLFHRLTLHLLGIRLNIVGRPSTKIPVLFVANHTSHLDIPILGSILQAGFVAKSEVAGWPLFGYLAKLQNTIFIERRSSRTTEQLRQLQKHLGAGQNLILFPEGTSSEGLTALPFKSSLFSIVEDAGRSLSLTIQPVSVTCTQIDGFPMLREDRAAFAWYGDMDFVPHLWSVFKRQGFTVDVIFHTPLTMADCQNRKLLAATCQDMVARGIELSLTGRAAPQEPALLSTDE